MGEVPVLPSDLGDQISQKTSGLIQSKDHRDLLDVVDTLRSRGVSHYVDLPQIIVCGSQSSGKSSTLESLSGIAFPTAEGLCTRFATELILRRGDKPEFKVHIQPGAGRSSQDRQRLAKFSRTSDQKDFPKIIERSRKVAKQLNGGVGYLMKKNKIDQFDGKGSFTDANTISVELSKGGTETVTFDNAIISTGSTTKLLPGTSLSEKVVTYEEQIMERDLPGSIIIAGAGAIGIEFAYVLKNYGVDVTIVEFLPRALPNEDA